MRRFLRTGVPIRNVPQTKTALQAPYADRVQKDVWGWAGRSAPCPRTPIVDHHTGTGTAGSTTNAGGQLAETGTDAATSWALGAGGVALAMGAALVAGTGRRRRVGA
ncbi:LPXTG cell wall anchor domain-containing protein [Streptomyces sp. NPDC059982]|uniref:LPXTG cell wall anchor domain-containing protein n=1 Tax=unclassified Streptomyces TaxID=2593676 RepID=UPI0036CB6380